MGSNIPNLARSFSGHAGAQTQRVQRAAWAAIKAASHGDVDGMVAMAFEIIDAAEKREELLAFAKALAAKERWQRANPGRLPRWPTEPPPFRPKKG